MRIRVLGAAAGGGFPQWNCGCGNCRGVRTGTIRATPRSQESVAVSADGEHWFLLNASPEIRSQVEAFPALHPRGPRQSPIAGIALTNGDLDHCLGLLSLRESFPLVVYATDSVRRGFTEENRLYRTLQRFPGQVSWRTLGPAQPLSIDGAPSGLTLEAIPVQGKRPVHLVGLGEPATDDNVGLLVRHGAKTLAYFPAAASAGPEVLAALEGADCLFFDGTFWSDDELVAQGLGTGRASDMAHLPVGGAAGSLRALAGCRARRRIYIHLNNSNPLLREDSDERALAEADGWEIAFDGMELEA